MVERLYYGDIWQLQERRDASDTRAKADLAERSGDHKEAARLRLLAECLFPSDPVIRAADWIEGETIHALAYVTRGKDS